MQYTNIHFFSPCSVFSIPYFYCISIRSLKRSPCCVFYILISTASMLLFKIALDQVIISRYSSQSLRTFDFFFKLRSIIKIVWVINDTNQIKNIFKDIWFFKWWEDLPLKSEKQIRLIEFSNFRIFLGTGLEYESYLY